ncbi:hypothetical protein SAMN02982931_04717 [Bauldia litoralis]|uniref:Uncharacterized protein n=1 Tax=Bauldia litoralis TaxID=665467 RepID=A0A1G6EMM9_9HYPH|nr:hypothetical protein SAMN02982931_04717 [Bauldia litoralis]
MHDDRTVGRFLKTVETWRHGATTISVRLTPISFQEMFLNDSMLVALATWQGQIDAWREEASRMDEGSRLRERLVAALDSTEDVSEEAESIFRVLKGLGIYSFTESRDEGSGLPVSGAPLVYFEGAEARRESTYSDPDTPETTKTSSAAIEPWTVREPVQGLPSGGYGSVLLVWRFAPEDMQRLKVLGDRIENLRTALTLDADGLTLSPTETLMLSGMANQFHPQFRDPLIAGLSEVVRYAWALGTEIAPAGIWAKSEDRLDPAYAYFESPAGIEDGVAIGDWTMPFLDREADLSLPALPTDTLVVLAMPEHGYPGEMPGEVIGDFDSFGTIHEYREFGGAPQYVATVGDDARTRHRYAEYGWMGSDQSFVHAARSGERFEGSVKFEHLSNIESFKNDGETRFFDENSETINVLWTIVHDGEIWQPPDVEIDPRLVTLSDGKFVPLEHPLNFGEAFAVEGRLIKPAARSVYRLLFDDGADQPVNIFLYPTDEDPRLVRSDLLYLMWDVTATGGGVEPVSAEVPQ